MSVGLTCYTSLAKEMTENIIKNMKENHHDIFDHQFLISDRVVDLEVSSTEMEAYSNESKRLIAAEFNFNNPKTYFYIRVNDKNEIGRSSEVAALVKEYFGKDNVIVLFEGETLY